MRSSKPSAPPKPSRERDLNETTDAPSPGRSRRGNRNAKRVTGKTKTWSGK